jgi:Concanavalin A-like lectin/glucanases superfamily/Right handed beta helix region
MRHALRRGLVLVGVLLSLYLATSASSATYYVSTSGNDSNSCSAATSVGTAKRNPANGADCLSAGDTLHIRAGTYNVGTWNGPPSGTSSARVTIAGYPPDGVRQAVLTFSGGGNGLVLESGSTWITFDNLVFQGTDLTSALIKFTGAQRIRFTNSEVYGGGTQGFLLVGNSSNNEFLKLIVHNNGVKLNLDHGFYFSAPDNIIDGCEIYANPGLGIHFYSEPPHTNVNANNIVRNSYVHDNGCGILLSNGDNQKAYNNLVIHNTSCGFLHYDGFNGLFLNNTIYNNGGDAFDFRDDGFSPVVCNNIILNNGSNSTSGASTTSNNITSGSVAFVNAGANDYHLAAGATNAIDKGTSGCSVSSNVTTDFEGIPRPVNGAWDIGAYEFGGTGTICPVNCTCTITPGVCDPVVGEQNPVAWWKFDEGVGTTASDFSGHAHTGTLVGGTTWTPGRVGSFAVQFDGVDDAVTIPDSVLTSWSADQSICLWAQVVNPSLIGSGNFKQTLVNLSPDSSNGVRLAVNEVSTPNGQWWVTVLAGGTIIAAGTSATPFTSNTWVHLCYTMTNTILALYVNSVQATTISNDAFTPAVANVLGGRDATTGNLGGKLDNVKIWNRALSAAEIVTEFGGTVGRVSHRGMFK